MKSPQILIIDDDPLILETVAEQVDEMGYAPCTVGDGATALRMLAAKDIVMALLDFRLPDMDGVTLLKQLRDLQPALPVVMISGSAGIPDAVEALKHGAVDFLVKPVDLDILESVVRRTMKMEQVKALL